MRSVSDLLALAGAKLSSHSSPGLVTDQPTADQPPPSDNAAFAAIGARIGDDNQVLRNLLIETSHQLGALDDLKRTFSKLVEPLDIVLSTLERERADNASTKGALAALRTTHETMRTDLQGLEKRSSQLESDNKRLNRDLERALQTLRQLEEDKSRLTGEAATLRTSGAASTKQLDDASTSIRVLSAEKTLLTERQEGSNKKILALENEATHARERIALLQNEKNSVQAALDRTLAESSRLSRRLAETETTLSNVRSKSQQLEVSLAAAEAERGRAMGEISRLTRQLTETEATLSESRGRVQQLEISLAAAEADRNKLAAAGEEASQRRQNDVYALELKLDGARSHSDTVEKLLAEAQRLLAERTEELGAAEATLLETSVAKNAADNRIERLVTANDALEQQVKKFDQENLDLRERCDVLSESVAATEQSLAHAKDSNEALISQVEQLLSDSNAGRAKVEDEIVQLNALIEHERAERAVVEGALERIRADYARLQREMAEERSTRRGEHQRRTARTGRTDFR